MMIIRTDEIRQGTIHKLKTDTRELAKAVWYDARLGWIQQLQQQADKGLAELEHVRIVSSYETTNLNETHQDAEILPRKRGELDAHVREREEEYEHLLRELETEEAEIAEIEDSDQAYLQELKDTIKEQSYVYLP
jgi:kinetochore protein Spc7/SPC105